MHSSRPAAGLPVLFETAGTVIDLAGHRDYARALFFSAVEPATLAALQDVAREVVCLCAAPVGRLPEHADAVADQVVCSGGRLPFGDQSFDLALWPAAASRPPDGTVALAEIYRVLRARGVLIAQGTAVAFAGLTRVVEEYGFSVDTVVAARHDEDDEAAAASARLTVTLAATTPVATVWAASTSGRSLILSLRAVKWGRAGLPEAIR